MRHAIPDDLYAVIFNRVPRVCIDLLIKNENGAVLLTLRSIPPWEGTWHFPGGGIRFKETLSEAANRIAKGELGVEVEIGRIVGACEIMNDDLPDGTERHSISVVVEVKLVSGEPSSLDGQSSDVGFFSELPENVHPFHGPFLERNDLMP